jgi:hypothetical protein
MGLEFTNRQDQNGACLYVIHDGSSQSTRRFDDLCRKVTETTQKQVVCLDQRTNEARMIIDFYDILPEQIPFMFIADDSDQVTYSWEGAAIPALPDDIIYALRNSL